MPSRAQIGASLIEPRIEPNHYIGTSSALIKSSKSSSEKGPMPGSLYGRIGSCQQSAGGALVVFWGCSGGPRRPCEGHLPSRFSLDLRETPRIEKMADFSYTHVGNGRPCPHAAKCALGGKMGPNMQKAIPCCSSPHQGLKFVFLSDLFFFSTPFRARGGLFAVKARTLARARVETPRLKGALHEMSNSEGLNLSSAGPLL